MGKQTDDSQSRRGECEECGATNVKSLQVQFGDGNVKRFELCENCLAEYQGADLIDEISTVDESDSRSFD